jgi:hypothetical protein
VSRVIITAEPAPVKIKGVSEQPAATPPERPSRYNRSFGGLLAAMVVTVVVVAAYVGIRAFFREQPDVRPEVDYLSCVAYLQAADVAVVHPERLPDGWRATSIHFERGTPPQWRLGVLTDRDTFVGVVQQKSSVQDLVTTYVDDSPIAGADASPENQLGVATWRTWSDAGGDHGYSAQPDSGPLAGETLLVYGSAEPDELQAFLGSLTLAPVGSGASAADCDTAAMQ